MKAQKPKESYVEKLYRGFYQNQNKKIHIGRAQLNMSLDHCRKIAEQISGKPSISSLSLEQRWHLIEALIRRGAKVINPYPPRELLSAQWKAFIEQTKPHEHEASPDAAVKVEVTDDNIYSIHLNYWNQRFPRDRRGFPSNRQLALIHTLWDMYFNDGRPGRGLRGWIFRQTRNLTDGPVSDLAFVKNNHIAAILTPLMRKAAAKKKGGGCLQNHDK